MAQTSPSTDRPDRQTPRQRRIEEQRRKIESLRREQRRKRLTFGAAGVLLAAVLIGLAVLLIKPPAAAQGHPVPIEGTPDPQTGRPGIHVPTGSQIPYRNRPPSSGDHYNETSGYGVKDREVEPGYWVHTLEHGGIVVLYRPDLCDQSCVSQLRDVYNSAPESQLFRGYKKMVVIPYHDLDHAIAVVAWGYVDELDAVDKDRILAFYRAHVDRGPEQAL